MLMLHAAWRDWKVASNGGRSNSNGSRTNSATPGPSSILFPALVTVGIWSWNYHWGGGGCGDTGLVLAVVAVVVASVVP